MSIAILTGAFTTKMKEWQKVKADSEKERMRANLLRAVSHDLRTPLTTIYGASSSIVASYDKLSDAQKKQMTEGIKEDSEWLIRMVENLLSITRIDSGAVKLIKTPTVLEELIDSVVLTFKKRYPEQQVEIDIPEEVILIPMDAILIKQVIINILEKIHMVFFNVQNYADFWKEVQKAVGVFACFGNKNIRIADTNIAINCLQDATHRDCRIFLGS